MGKSSTETKNAASHTPGPWSYHSWGKGNGIRFGIETSNHNHGLAGVAPNENASTLLTIAEHEANARLMAAAPDLLDACLRTLAAIDGGEDMSEGHVCIAFLRKAVRLARGQ